MNEGWHEDGNDDDLNNDIGIGDNAKGRRGQRVLRHLGNHNDDDEIEYDYQRLRRRRSYENRV